MNRTIITIGLALLMLGAIPANAKNAPADDIKAEIEEGVGASNASCPLGAGVHALALGSSISSSLPNVLAASCEFSVAAPAASDVIVITLSGLQSDFDLYTRLNGIPTTTLWNCRPFSSGTTVETCATSVNPGDFVGVMVRRFTGSGTFTVSASVPTPLENGVPAQVSLSGTGASKLFKLAVPAGSTVANVLLTPGNENNAGSSVCHVQAGVVPCTPDADLYVRYNAIPTTSLFTCRPFTYGNVEHCTFSSDARAALGEDPLTNAGLRGVGDIKAFNGAGNYFVMVRSFSGAPSVTVTGSFA